MNSVSNNTTTTPSNIDAVTFKAHCASRDETRLFILPKSGLSFKALSSRLADLFGTSDLHVQYLDDENDLIVIKTDDELVAAVQFFSGKPSVRLIVSTKLVEPKVAAESASQEEVGHAKQAQVSPSLEEEEEKKKRRESHKARRELRVAMGPALKQLEEMGFTKKGVCVRLLIKFDGDVQKVAEEMRAWQQAHDLRKEQKHAQKKELKRLEKEEKRALKQQLREEKEKYKYEKRALKMALKEEKKKKKEEVKYSKKDRMSNEELAQLEPKLAQLEELGFHCQHKAMRLLQKHEGDVEKVASILTYKREEKLQRCAKKLEKWQAKKQKKSRKYAKDEEANESAHCKRISNEEVILFEPQLKQLEEMGFNRRYQAIRLLKKHEGDVAKVASILTRKREERLKHVAKRQEKWQALEDKHKDALAALAERGFTCKRLNIRLLERNDNDMEKVAALLAMIEEKKRHRQLTSQPVLIN
jgi:orotate phosphoribosyltransferase